MKITMTKTGETLEVKVSSERGRPFALSLHRVICGDDGAEGGIGVHRVIVGFSGFGRNSGLCCFFGISC